MKQENRTPLTPGEYVLYVTIAFAAGAVLIGIVAFAHWALVELSII
jgi:hypothetical protein